MWEILFQSFRERKTNEVRKTNTQKFRNIILILKTY
jgi:hypothetical protein